MLQRLQSIVPLSNICHDDKDLFGEKAANLGEMEKQGFPLPDGFVITQNAYHLFALKHNLPDRLIKEIFRAYKRLEGPLKDAAVEIFISNPILQKKEVVIAKGEAVLIEKIKSIWAHHPSAIVVRKIPQTSSLGIMFTVDPIHNDKTKISIREVKTGSHYEVLKENLKLIAKEIKIGKKQLLTDKQLIEAARWGKKLQEYCYFPQEVHFAIEKNKIYITQTKPITQISLKFNPSTKLGTRVQSFDKAWDKSSKLRNANYGQKLLLKGNPLYSGIATGHLRIIQSMQDFNKILRGEVIVVPYQDLVKHPAIKAGAIVATDDRLHQIQHLPIGPFFSGKPTIITTPETANILRNGAVVTINGKNGEVYMGS